MNHLTKPQNPMARVMSLRDFRLLFSGAFASLLGDQFTLIATPWLVLQMTNDPMALGIVLALEGLPRALLMLLGGVVTDRFSPRRVMLVANVTRFFLTAGLAATTYLGIIQIWMIYAFGLAFGVVAGFAIPAENSIVPMLVAKEDLQAGNSLMLGVTKLVGFAGPTAAGILIGTFSRENTGVVLAFAVDALSFVFSAVSLQLIRSGKAGASAASGSGKENLWSSILDGFRCLWADPALRLVFLVHLTLNCLLIGPIMVGIPVLADQRLAEGAAAFGLLMSAYAGGNLLGYLTAGALPRPGAGRLQVILILFIAAFGGVIAALGFISFTWLDFAMLLVLGLGEGYLAIILFTWIQAHTPKEILGRMMGLLMFANTGLVPLSQAVAGAVSKWNLTLLFVISGTLVVCLAFWTAFNPDLPVFGASLAAAPAEE